MLIDRRTFCAAALSSAALPAAAAEPATDITYVQDFDELWETLRDRYCFFGEKATDWELVRRKYRPRALAAGSSDELLEVLRLTLHELYDAHTHLASPPDGSPRFPPYDLVVEPASGAARILAVQDRSIAARVGLKPGWRILTVDGVAVADLTAQAMPRCLRRPDAEAVAYAWNTAVAGRRRTPRIVTVDTGSGEPVRYELPLLGGDSEPDLEYRRLDDGFGYIRIASFAEDKTVGAFDAALEALREAPGLLIDVRRNGGGDTAVARPIMGRFISERHPYARMRRREGRGLGPFWTEHVDPRGPFTYRAPVVVLTDPWSASMAEGFPMGMRGLGRARIVGGPMMRLGAAVFAIRLDRTGIEAQYSAEPVYDVNGAPRWLLEPDVRTAPGEDILAAGVQELRRMLSR